jgi:hypothetical protein
MVTSTSNAPRVVLDSSVVFAAARTAGATFLATYDRKDLLSKRQEILTAFGVTVATPDEILANI